MTIKRLLVANRGEIAVRIFRTCTRLGIETVAVTAPDDRDALHARKADTTVEIPSYLDAAALVRAARSCAAEAIHPGYGFLAESAGLAQAVEAAGIAWLGPPADALRRGGDKLEAKRIASENGISLLPSGEPEHVGYPLIVKAAAGGGGRGMRVVTRPEALDAERAAAAREAESAFADGTVYCERYLPRPRHVEVQLLADASGTVVALGERDCSIQRRHQKIVEESPAPKLAPLVRERLIDEAVRFATAIGYRSAGTVEFLVDGDEVYFLELNGRIQVEHPVTEEVTGLDLVELQIRIAEGLELDELVVPRHGHAIEARLYAEDPNSFLPRSGRVDELRLPTEIRVDAGVEVGDEIGTRYDPLIAKLIAHGSTRAEACERLTDALASTMVGGVVTNLPFLRWLVAHPAFREAELSTAFLVDHPPLSIMPLRRAASPWRKAWRLNLPAPLPAAPPQLATTELTPSSAAGGVVVAPMPGLVLDVAAAAGDRVSARQTLVVIEAMKLEHPVIAPFAATVASVRVAVGEQVTAGTVLVELEPPASAG